ncbi:GIY-YIG nuclease family protein [Candidatus Peribacteria bacterium]|nr:MAG: GIY-YIG nuclease family protein [Candidatus Peribacteria bacterium]
MRYFVYILKNERQRNYVGYTEDLNARLEEHNIGNVSSTKIGRPWKVEWFCCFREKAQAIAFEKYLKSGSGVTFRKNHLLQKSDPQIIHPDH